ncbi:MAG: allophanate hydrolase subunit 1 [Anditalea sp.]
MDYPIKYRYISPFILEVCWPADICEGILLDIIRLKKGLQTIWGPDLRDMTMGYHCLSLHFNSAINFPLVLSEIEEVRTSTGFSILPARKRWHIPICYDLEFGKDLSIMAKTTKLNIEEIIDLHSSTIYLLYFYGFMPGFMYLGGLAEELYTPRKNMPDRKVKKGSLAIGGRQTGIYPMDSPGGWSIIGKTPVNIFNLHSKDLVLAQPGDEIQFEKIDKDLFYFIQDQDAASRYVLKNETIHGQNYGH